MLDQNRLLIAAEFVRPKVAALSIAPHQLDHATRADAENPPHLVARAASLDRSHHALPKIVRKRLRHPCWPPAQHRGRTTTRPDSGIPPPIPTLRDPL